MEVRKKKQLVEEPVYVPPQATEEEMYQYSEQQDYMSEEDKKLAEIYKELVKVYGDDAPMISTLEAWKKKWDHIHVSRIGADRKEYYIWRTLRRYEYKEMAKGGAMEDQDSANELLVEKCLLYPIYDFTFRQQSEAGVITTLGQQISYRSGFVSQQEALALVFIA